MSVAIKTNNVPRDLLYWFDLTKKEQKEFDHESAEDSCYFRFKGQVYCMDNFLCLHNKIHMPQGQDIFPGWDGYESDSFFSGIVIRYPRIPQWRGEPVEDVERVIVGTYRHPILVTLWGE